MEEKNMDVFARATLFLYQKRLESLGLEADLRVVPADNAKKKDADDENKVC